MCACVSVGRSIIVAGCPCRSCLHLYEATTKNGGKMDNDAKQLMKKNLRHEKEMLAAWLEAKCDRIG